MARLILIFTSFLFFVSIKASAETAVESLKEIKRLYETKGFEKLVKEYYSEIHKVSNDEEVQKMIQMVSQRFGNEKNLKMVVMILDEALKVEPKIVKNPSPNDSEEEDMALFPIKFHGKEIDYKLYQMKTGKWGFHF